MFKKVPNNFKWSSFLVCVFLVSHCEYLTTSQKVFNLFQSDLQLEESFHTWKTGAKVKKVGYFLLTEYRGNSLAD